MKINKIYEGNFFKQEGAKTYFHSGVINNSTGLVANIFSVILGQSNVSRSGTFIIINATAISSSNISWINLSNVKISDPKGISVSLIRKNGTLKISPASIGNSSPVASWKFDENTGKNASDSSGNSNHGTISGANWTAGKIGRALSFNGVKMLT